MSLILNNEVQEIHGRKVIVYRLKGLKSNCGDCGSDAKWLITELESGQVKINFPDYSPSWFYCGECDIGG